MDRGKIEKRYLESRIIINAHAWNEGMSLTERKENIDIEVEAFLDQIIELHEEACGNCTFKMIATGGL